MTAAKIAISVPWDLLARVRAAVKRGEAASVSAYVSKALEEKLGEDDIFKMFDEMLEETGGPLTPEEIRWADEKLGLVKPKRRRKSRA
jgi:hypothetical protein